MIFLITFTFSIELSHVIHLTTQGSKAHGDHLCPLIGEKHLSQLDPANAMCSCCAKSFSSEAASNCSSEIWKIIYLDTKSLKKVGKLISNKTMERRSTSFLRQSISMEIQRGNCASILGTVESPKILEELFHLFNSKSDHYHS